MIKTILLGLWVCAVTLVSTWAGATYLSGEAGAAHSTDSGSVALELIKPRQISVPMIKDGAIQGYVMVKLTFTARKGELSKLSIDPQVFIVDEAFRTIYSSDPVDFKRIAKQDISALGRQIKDGVNKRFGVSLIEDVLFEEVNYVPMEKVRGGGRMK